MRATAQATGNSSAQDPAQAIPTQTFRSCAMPRARPNANGLGQARLNRRMRKTAAMVKDPDVEGQGLR
eukprot:5377026-Amphidinium_carterae.1